MSMARRLLGPDGPLARAFAGYEERAGQLDMADAVERALAEDRDPALRGRHRHRQDARLPRPGHPQRAQGGRLHRDQGPAGADLRQGPAAHRRAPRPRAARRAGARGSATTSACAATTSCAPAAGRADRSRRCAGRSRCSRTGPRDTETGDVAELAALAEGDPIWREVYSSSETRIGAELRLLRRLLRHADEARPEQARVLVVNHHLFFADLALKRRAEPGAAARGAAALRRGDLRRGAPARGRRHRLLRRARLPRPGRGAGARRRSGLRRRRAGRSLRAKGEGTALTGLVREAADALFDQLRLAPRQGRRGPEGRVTLPRGRLDRPARSTPTTGSTARWRRSPATPRPTPRTRRCASSPAAPPSCAPSSRASSIPHKNQVTWVEVRARSVSLGASPVDLGSICRARGVRAGSAPWCSPAPRSPPRGSAAPSATCARAWASTSTSPSPSRSWPCPRPSTTRAAALLYTPRDLPEVNDADFVDARRRPHRRARRASPAAARSCSAPRPRHARLRRGACAAGRRTRRSSRATRPKQMLLAPLPRRGRRRAGRDDELLGGRRRPGRRAAPGGHRQAPLRRAHRSGGRRPLPRPRGAGQNPFLAYSVPEAAITLKQGFGRLHPHADRSGHRGHPRPPHAARAATGARSRVLAARAADRQARGRASVLGRSPRAAGKGGLTGAPPLGYESRQEWC